MTFLSTLGTGISAALGICAILGGVWWVVKPRVRQQITGRLDAIHSEVKNTHSTNLREDIDAKADASQVAQLQRDVTGMVTLLREPVDRNRARLDQHDTRIEHLAACLERVDARLERIEAALMSRGVANT